MSSSSGKLGWREAKRRTDSYVREWEADEKLSLSVSRRRSKLFPASKVAGGASRRDHIQDQAIFQAIISSVGAGNAVCLGKGRRSVVSKGGVHFPELADEGEDEKGRAKDTIWTPDWTHTGDRLKALSIAQAMMSDGETTAFTVDLHPFVIKQAFQSPRGVVGYLSDRLTRNLAKQALDTRSWAFVVEASPLHEPHLHGLLRKGPTEAMRDALFSASGQKGLRTGREVHTRDVWHLNGWLEYITKNPLVSRKALNRAAQEMATSYSGGILGASRQVRSDAARWYREHRGAGRAIN